MKTQHSNNLLPHLILNVGTILAVAFMLFAYTAWAAPSTQTPGVISYQGTLTDDAGQPISGNIGMTFRLYDQPTNGPILWTESHTNTNAVPVQNGLFHVLLGSLNPISSTVWANNPLYLGVQVTGEPDEMMPREVLGAVPMAMSVSDKSITTTKLVDGAVTNEKLNLSYWLLNLPNGVVITANNQANADEAARLDVDFPTDGIYLLIAKVISSSDAADKQLTAEIWDENGFIWDARIINTHPKAGDNGRETGTIVTIQPFSAGSHTIRLMAYMNGSSSDGLVKGATELIVIPLGGQLVTP